jgi:hypothetical protein
MGLFSIGFLGSEFWALPGIVRSIDWKFGRRTHWIDLVALPVLIVDVLVVVMCVYLLLPPTPT